MRALDLRALLAALNDARVNFVVIGGVAVGAHGYVRATDDVDIVPDRAAENVRRLGNALVALGATLPLAGDREYVPADDNRRLARGESLTLDTREAPLTSFSGCPGVPSFRELEREAIATELLGVPVRICSLEHLRKMKEARAGSQDRADLERLPPSA